MNTMISRRFFIGGAFGFAALGPRRTFAAKPGAFADGKPALTFGVLSDVHIGLASGGRKLHPNYDTRHLEKAFAYFRDQGADAVVIAGDMAHHGCAGELKAVADAWFKVFPNDRAPDGRHVERLFVFGNHDNGAKRAAAVFGDVQAAVKANLLTLDPKRHWDAAFHEEWTPFFRRSWKDAKPKPCVEIAIPPAMKERSAPGIVCKVSAPGADGQELVVSVLTPAFRHAPTAKRVHRPTVCRIALDRLAPGDLEFKVRAVSAWGRTSDPLVGTFGRPPAA